MHSCIFALTYSGHLVSSQEDLHVFVSFFFFLLSLAGRVDGPKEPKYRHLCEVDLSASVNVYLHEYGVKDSVY